MTGSAQRPEKPGSRDGCVSRMLSLQLQKSPTPDFEEKCGNSPDISKGISQLGIYKFESSEVSQPVRRMEILPPAMLEMPANCGIFRFNGRSPGARFGHFRLGLADSLRRIFEIFLFSGDGGRRPASLARSRLEETRAIWALSLLCNLRKSLTNRVFLTASARSTGCGQRLIRSRA
jgi:hypothetical protein